MQVSEVGILFSQNIFNDDFIIRIDSRRSDSDNTIICIPLRDNEAYNFRWEVSGGLSGVHSTDTGENLIISVPTPGEYVVRIKYHPDYTFSGLGIDPNADRRKDWISILCWSSYKWKSFYRTFWHDTNLTIAATDPPIVDLSYPTTGFDYTFANIKESEFAENLNFGNAYRLYFTFAYNNCVSFPELDYSGIREFHNTWYRNHELLSFPTFDASDATVIMSLFRYCTKLKHGPVTNTENTTNVHGVYAFCYVLESYEYLDLGSATNTSDMFYYCKNITTHQAFDLSSCITANFMFRSNTSVTKFPMMNMESIEAAAGMFGWCTANTDVENYAFTKCLNLSECWYANREITSIAITCPVVENIKKIFVGCSKLKTIDVDFSSVLHADNAFMYCYELADFDFRTLNLINAESLDNTFFIHQNTPITTQRYTELLIWLDENNVKDNVVLGAGLATYDNTAVDARNRLIDRGWTISDGGLEE